MDLRKEKYLDWCTKYGLFRSKNSDSDPGSNPIIVLCIWDVILILALQCEKFCILQCSHFVFQSKSE